MTPPVLWHFPISHFNEKVRWALDYKGIPHVRRALGASYLPRALWATGQPRLPILFVDGGAVTDSTRIIAALEARHPEPALYPVDPAARRRALALEDFFDEELGHPLRTALLGPVFKRDPAAAIRVLATGMSSGSLRMMTAATRAFRAYYRHRHAINDASIAASRGRVEAALARIERERQPSGYLVGDGFTVADLTAAAILAVLSLPSEMQYRPAPPFPPELDEYRASLATRPALQWVTEMYRRHRGRSAEIPA
jgi:glutathione S-transferase